MDSLEKYEIIASGVYHIEVIGDEIIPAGIVGDGSGVTAVEESPGVVNLTLPGDGIAQQECVVLIQLCFPQSIVGGLWDCPSVFHINDAEKIVYMGKGGIPQTSSFMFSIFRSRKRNT